MRFWVVGDPKRRGDRDRGRPGGAPRPLEDEDEDGVFGVEWAMYKFEAVVIALVSRVVVPEMALLIKFEVSVRAKGDARERTLPDEDGSLQHPVTVFGWDGAHEHLLVPKPIDRICTFRQLNYNRVPLTALLRERLILMHPNRIIERADDLPIVFIHQHKPPTEVLSSRSLRRSFDQPPRPGLGLLQFTLNAEVSDVSFEHAVEELDVVRHDGELDGKLCVIPCGMKDVAPCAGGQYGRDGEGARWVERLFARDVVAGAGS
jgi:hypothetical protein